MTLVLFTFMFFVIITIVQIVFKIPMVHINTETNEHGPYSEMKKGQRVEGLPA